ncbi:MAG: hypothetical protein WC515_01125 [Candidatus Omnitrophota bacterium]
MKNIIIAIVILVVSIAALLEFRYTVIVDSPVVVRVDRLTGDAWIVNSGVWRKVQLPSQGNGEEVMAVIPERGRKAK